MAKPLSRKGALIRQVLREHPEWSNTEIIGWLNTNHHLKVKPYEISNIRCYNNSRKPKQPDGRLDFSLIIDLKKAIDEVGGLDVATSMIDKVAALADKFDGLDNLQQGIQALKLLRG